MKDNLPRYTLRINPVLLDKIAYIAESEGRSKNREIEQLIKKRILEFERENGKIELKK
ncbi:Arc family DNA-binding protein [Feifania hominis]|uniref:Arc family DNA-binding protein n=1 Tax=Feifania hominis TaxID=2763660 RepID=A0A926DDV4_9FIRM|nr:Arc family DNA-binding protein [Feifania hominis]